MRCPYCQTILERSDRAHVLKCRIQYEDELAATRADVTRLEREKTELINAASIWRNRAIGAEEELSGTNRIID